MINGSDLVFQPWNTTWSPYTNLLGFSFFIIPIAFIGAALFVKTRDPTLVSLYFIITGMFLTGGGVWFGAMGAAMLFLIVTILGVASLIYNVFYGGK